MANAQKKEKENGVLVMSFIQEKTNEDLLWEFERIINRIQSYSGSGEYKYKDDLKAELLKRLNQQNDQTDVQQQKEN